MSRSTSSVCTIAVLVAASLAQAQVAAAQSIRQRIQKSRESTNDARQPANNPRGRAANVRSSAQSVPASESVARWVSHLGRLQPKDAEGYADLRLEFYAQGVSGVEYWVGQLARFEGVDQPQGALQIIEQLLAAKAGIDRQLETAFVARTDFAALEPGERRQTALANYLWATSGLIDLSGRLRVYAVRRLEFGRGHHCPASGKLQPTARFAASIQKCHRRSRGCTGLVRPAAGRGTLGCSQSAGKAEDAATHRRER